MASEISSDGLSPRAQALLEAARRQGGPSSAQRTALTAAVMTSTASAAAGVSATAGAASLVKVIGAGLVATVVGASGTAAVLRLQRSAPPPPPRSAPATPRPASPPRLERAAPETPSPAAAEPVVERQAPPAPLSPRLAAPPTERTEPSAPPPPTVEPATPEIAATPPPTRGASVIDSSAEEVTALGAALEALEAGDATTALELARQSRRAHPAGVLRPELMVIEIDALCALNRADDARALAGTMTAADRTPLVNEKLRRSCLGR